MPMAETELKLVARHVREGAEALERHRQALKKLAKGRYDLGGAMELLAGFEMCQAQHAKHLALLKQGKRRVR